MTLTDIHMEDLYHWQLYRLVAADINMQTLLCLENNSLALGSQASSTDN